MGLKRFCVFCLAAVTFSANSMATTSIQTERDSLLTLIKELPKAGSENRHIELLTHLTMLCADNGDAKYAKELFNVSAKQKNIEGIKCSFYALVETYSNVDAKALTPYIKDVSKLTTGNVRDALLAYANMRIKYGELILSSRFKNNKRIDELKTSIMKKEGVNNAYDEIAWNSLLGQFLLVHGGNYDIHMNAADYFNAAIKKSKSLPLELAFPIKKSADMGLANLYLADPDKMKDAFALLKNEESDLDKLKQNSKKFPFYNDNGTRMQLYAMFLTIPQLLDKNSIAKYMEAYKGLVNIKRSTPQAPIVLDSYYTTLAYHYQRIGDINNAINYVDSGIVSAKRLGMTFQLPGRLKWKAKALEMVGRNDEALKTYDEYIPINDSIYASSTQEKMSELQTAFGLQKERAEKAEMQLSHQHDMTILYGVIFLMMLVIIVYQIILYVKARKEQGLKSQLLVAKEKALDVEKMKTTFTESMIRELRTPMNAINGSAEIILDENIEKNEKEVMVNMLKDNVTYLSYLIDHMIVVSELNCESSKPGEMELANINEICNMELQNEKLKAGKPEINVVNNVAESEDWVIGINKRYFIMMLHQLVDNAFYFTTLGKIVIDGELLGDKIKISVSDTGIGIPEDKHEYVFDSYSKIDSYSKGMGLGLYICKLIAKKLGGKVWIDKEYMGGTKVSFILPCDKNMRFEK